MSNIDDTQILAALVSSYKIAVMYKYLLDTLY